MKYLHSVKNNQRGFTILFAVLVASIILAVVVSVMNIALKQLKFSGIGRESQFAYYAADTGVECALFWDFRSEEFFRSVLFATSSASKIVQNPTGLIGTGADITCGRTQIYIDGGFNVRSNPLDAATNFEFEIETTIDGVTRKFCSNVTVFKEYDSSKDRITTNISSRGYNDSCTPTSRSRFERGLEVNY